MVIYMEPIKLDNLYLGINDDKMNFLSINFRPFPSNPRSSSYFFTHPTTSEIIEVKHGEKFPEVDGYVNGFLDVIVQQRDTLKKDHEMGFKCVSNPDSSSSVLMPKEIKNIYDWRWNRDWMQDDRYDKLENFHWSLLFRPIPSAFVEFAYKMKQADNDMKLDFYHSVRTSYLNDKSNVKIDMLQNAKNYFYNLSDNSISSIDKQSDRIKVEFDEDTILKSVMLPSIVSGLVNNENVLKRNMVEFYQKVTHNKTDELSYVSSFLPSKTITYLYFTMDNMNSSNTNEAKITLPDFIKQVDKLIKAKLHLTESNINEDGLNESKKQLSNPIKFTNELIDNSFMGQQLLPEINKFLEAKIGKHGVTKDIYQLEKENVTHHLHNFIMHRATELFNIALLNHQLDNGNNLKQEKQNIPTQLIAPSGNRWHEQLIQKIYFEEMDKNGIQHMRSVIDSKDKMENLIAADQSEENNVVKRIRKQKR